MHAAAASSKPLRALLIGGGYAAAKATDRPFAVEASGVSFETGEADSVIFSCSSEQERQDKAKELKRKEDEILEQAIGRRVGR